MRLLRVLLLLLALPAVDAWAICSISTSAPTYTTGSTVSMHRAMSRSSRPALCVRRRPLGG